MDTLCSNLAVKHCFDPVIKNKAVVLLFKCRQTITSCEIWGRDFDIPNLHPGLLLNYTYVYIKRL